MNIDNNNANFRIKMYQDTFVHFLPNANNLNPAGSILQQDGVTPKKISNINIHTRPAQRIVKNQSMILPPHPYPDGERIKRKLRITSVKTQLAKLLITS